jgi:hypothetical protein
MKNNLQVALKVVPLLVSNKGKDVNDEQVPRIV